jgi:hypothetical protein
MGDSRILLIQRIGGVLQNYYRDVRVILLA